jgi:hypothetical protein
MLIPASIGPRCFPFAMALLLVMAVVASDVSVVSALRGSVLDTEAAKARPIGYTRH